MECTFHNTPSIYMDRDRGLKAMTQFSNICSASPVNNQILFFNGQNSYFDDHALTQTQSKNIQPFILKVGDPLNSPNSKLKALYNILKVTWMLK